VSFQRLWQQMRMKDKLPRGSFDTDFEPTQGVKTITTFEEMGINDDLLRGI
ncbi:hypothetical protein A2U01_0041312, partial [Trifolium medium]|nr:hypothetical protein [Trifolium medium]